MSLEEPSGLDSLRASGNRMVYVRVSVKGDCVCVCVCVHECAHVCVYVRARMYACMQCMEVSVCVCV